MNNIQFEHLPGAVEKLLNEVSEIKKVLKTENRNKEPSSEVNVTLKNALIILKKNGYEISKSKMYKLTSANEIPHYKFGNRLVFNEKELINWVKSLTVLPQKALNDYVIINNLKHRKSHEKK